MFEEFEEYNNNFDWFGKLFNITDFKNWNWFKRHE